MADHRRLRRALELLDGGIVRAAQAVADPGHRSLGCFDAPTNSRALQRRLLSATEIKASTIGPHVNASSAQLIGGADRKVGRRCHRQPRIDGRLDKRLDDRFG